MKKKTMIRLIYFAAFGVFLAAPPPSFAQTKSTVVEEIVARVNNQIITESDYRKADQQLKQEIAQQCQKCPQAKMDAEYEERQKELLRDLIDQQLLVERAKDMSISVDTDLIKRLDEVRKENGLATMEDLEKAVESQGIAWEDYKTQISNGLMTQQVIRQEVGSRLDIGSDEVKQYYEAHKDEFNRPEQVDLGEIFLGTDGKSPEEIAAIHTKAEDLRNRVVKGEDFDELAKRYSEGSTAKDGGGLGTFERGQLSPQLEDAVFKMQKGQVTDVTQTKTGFEILKVLNHYDAGLQPLDKVEGEITNKLYTGKMQPALRDYLAQLREESYVMVKPGYTDSAAVAGATVIEEVPPTPDATAKKKKEDSGAESQQLMKSHFVADLSEGQSVASFFLVREKEIRTSVRTGTSWLHLELTDRTGTIPAKMWDNFSALVLTFERDDVIQIRGRVKLFNGQKELTLEQIIPAVERDYELSDFLPHTKYNVEKLFADLHASVDAVRNPWIKRLLLSVVDDPAIAPKLKRAPAAMTMHHAYIGGLIEHVVSMIGLAAAVSAHYPELDPDLLLAGVILHDIGKIDELRYVRGIEYSTEGRLLGHIMIGALLVREKVKAIPEFPPALAVLIEHLILSHHGTHEFGSPSLPQTREAVALHFIDDIDSKMNSVRSTLELSPGIVSADLWSDRNPSLRRSLLRSEKFLANDAVRTAGNAQPAGEPAPSESVAGFSSPAKKAATSPGGFNFGDLSGYSSGDDVSPARTAPLGKSEGT